jgi:hypothetical protein
MKNFRIHIIFVAFLLLTISSCKQRAGRKEMDDYFSRELVTWNKNLTEVVITDVLTPPVCSRAYAYSNIAAYEALRNAYAGQPSFAGKLNGLSPVPQPMGNKNKYYLPLSAMIAFSTVAQKMVFNSDMVSEKEVAFLEEVNKFDIDHDVFEASVNYGREVGQHIIDWASKDGYLQRNALPGYLVTRENGRWQPTPPDYADAIEPNWHTLRPFVLDSASQFRPPLPDMFDTINTSAYYANVLQVYKAVSPVDSERIAIAKFWDCNPNISVTQGHVMYFQQKISPAGHWLNVAATICEKEKSGEMKTAEVLSKVAIAMADGFINCWEAKFHYNAIRPETVINRYIDKDWRPLLQTPPFPEYPSGHSVISGASAMVLTQYFGDSYSYTDSTELQFGIPSRKYTSFTAAADEASVSRLYGGIHYLPSLNNGLEEGKKIGTYILAKLK